MIYNIIVNNFLEPISNVLYLAAVVMYYRYSRLKDLKILMFCYAATALLMLLSSIIVLLDGHNIIFYEIAGLVTAICIGSYFYRLFDSPVKKKLIAIIICTYVVYFFWKQLIFSGDRLFDSLGYALISISVFFYVLMYFHHLMSNIEESNIFRQFNFWLASAYIIYYTGNFIVFASYYYLTVKIIETFTAEQRALLTALWGVHNILQFFTALGLLFSTVWLTYPKRSVSLS